MSEKKPLNEARINLGLDPLVPEPKPRLPEHMWWVFSAWVCVVLFGILAQRGFHWLGVSVLILAASFWFLAHWRVRRDPHVSYRHPYRDRG